MVGLLVNADIALKIGVRLQRWRLLAMIQLSIECRKKFYSKLQTLQSCLNY
jgi:hypothetical protein